jgi:hypothetical protein
LKKTTQKNDRIVNINKENMKLIAFMYIRVIISPVRKYSMCGFRKINRNILYTHNSYNMLKKKKTFNINIASIFITLTEINNEAHHVAKKNK